MGVTRALRRLLGAAAIVYLVTFLAVIAQAMTHQNPANAPQADVIVCLGAGSTATGGIGVSSAVRADACAALYQAGAAPVIVFTGANSDPSFPSIGQVMADHAIAQGVPPEAVRVEGISRSTLQNALFSAPLLADADTILLVTHGYHLPRSRASFAAIGDWQIESWSAQNLARNARGKIDHWALPREALAIWFNLARYLLWSLAKTAGLPKVDDLLI